MKNLQFLEIVVPTYNRASILRSTLRELCAFVAIESDIISLRVIDNCSTDETSSVIESFADRGLLAAERNESNIGLIKNIAKCIETSPAEWVWVFGDDDHILLHCLPMLIKSLRAFPQDVVFARGLAAKVNEDGCLVCADSPSKYMDFSAASVYENGLEITAKGNIHSLAFISTLFVRTRYWNQDYHDSIYQASDLYTFVLTLLRTSASMKTADLNFHVVAATDRGDRSYYTKNMCIARLTEYTSFEQMVHDQAGRRKALLLLRQGRKGLLKLRIASCFKLIAYRDSYRIRGTDPVAFLQSYRSPYTLDQWVVRLLGALAAIPGTRRISKYVYDGLFQFNHRRNNLA